MSFVSETSLHIPQKVPMDRDNYAPSIIDIHQIFQLRNPPMEMGKK
jgi:hypothetical protein